MEFIQLKSWQGDMASIKTLAMVNYVQYYNIIYATSSSYVSTLHQLAIHGIMLLCYIAMQYCLTTLMGYFIIWYWNAISPCWVMVILMPYYSTVYFHCVILSHYIVMLCWCDSSLYYITVLCNDVILNMGVIYCHTISLHCIAMQLLLSSSYISFSCYIIDNNNTQWEHGFHIWLVN